MDRDPVSFKLLFQIFIVILSLAVCCFDITKGARTSFQSIAPVCSGDQLELICNTTGRIHEWSFSSIPNTRALTSLTRGTSYLMVNSVTFNFTRISVEGISPLVSRLVISPVESALNGTSVNCTDQETSETQSTTVVISNEDLTWPSNGLVSITVITSEVFESGNVTVTLEWTQVNSLYTYHVIIVPQVEQRHNGSTQVQFTALYNAHYNVIVVAEHSCGQNNVTTSKELYYAKCENPANESEIDDSIMIIGYSEPALEGSTISLSCPSGMVLTGSSTLTCMESGEWEPHLKRFMCLPLTCTCNRTNMTVTEQLFSDVKIIAVASSVSVLVITSVLFFVIGCSCGLFCRKQNIKQETVVVPSLVETSSAVYDNVTVIQNNTNLQESELQENIAYGPGHCMQKN